MRFGTRGKHEIDDEYLAARIHLEYAVSQYPFSLAIRPIHDNLFYDVGITAGWHGMKHVTAANLAPTIEI